MVMMMVVVDVVVVAMVMRMVVVDMVVVTMVMMMEMVDVLVLLLHAGGAGGGGGGDGGGGRGFTFAVGGGSVEGIVACVRGDFMEALVVIMVAFFSMSLWRW